MKKINMNSVCNQAVSENHLVLKDWGFHFLVGSEIEALRIAYAYRNNPHGVKVEHCPTVEKFMVTVWNDKAKAMGCDV